MKKSLGAITLLYPTPVLVIGTYDKKGRANMMTAAWGGICCSDPPCVAVSIRKATYTYGNIVDQRAFTVNIPSKRYANHVDYAGIASGKTRDKFLDTGLTPVKSELISAPYIEEFPVILECRLFQSNELGLHIQFIGEILDVKVNDECLGENNLPEVGKVQPMLYAPGNSEYYGVGPFIGKAFAIGRSIR